MLCEVCKKEEANIHFTTVINGEVTKMNICESCAEEKGIGGISFSKGVLSGFQDFAVGELLAELKDFEIASGEEKLKCTNCGLSYHDFKRIGRLGCSECYKAFRADLIPLLNRIHGESEHRGKMPSQFNKRKELFSLQKELQEAIAIEEYERAAHLRDKIRAIKKNQT